MVEIGGRPILWHIMKIYSSWGFNDFIICCGYKAYSIKEYFADYYLHNCDITFDFTSGKNVLQVHSNATEPWKVTLIDTGLHTMTGGRIKRIRPYVGNEPFMLTYGDGVSDVNIENLLAFHQSHGKTATITTVNPGQRFGIMDVEEDGLIKAFREKSDTDGSLVNGGFFVLEPEVFDYIEGDKTIFEKEPLEGLAAKEQLMAYRHTGFWKCMDTQNDRDQLEKMWNGEEAQWKRW
jgi:glucose-1-phosphate cytidylyltransferase